MPRPLLPPKGIFIPTSMIYNSSLPPSLLQTWLQMRGMAWGRDVTPPICIQEISALIGKSQSTIYGHMSQLRRISALSWRSTGQGKLIVSFIDHPSQEGDIRSDSIPDSRNLELPSHSSPHDEYPDLVMIPELKQDIPESNNMLWDEIKAQGEGEFEGERGRAGDAASGQEPPAQPVPSSRGGSRSAPAQYTEPGRNPGAVRLHSGPVIAYRSLVHLTPSAVQRRILAARVSDLPLWQRTLEHWLGHGWNPRNLTGMLELYQRGGPEGCRYCRPTSQASRQPETSLEHTLAAIQALQDLQEPPPGL